MSDILTFLVRLNYMHRKCKRSLHRHRVSEWRFDLNLDGCPIN
ncbi:hypothetical protein I547_6743 [Mycobacterium kansasii 824]|uniref:Uncharacterized protein n=1 Tax=Mycobacterium kansasii TaxID=1768 RepID=A0A1V3WUG5_MYCKA|nr:hypothetical protein I547_6743 [Mycobacterium kansasii 824]OOK70565.1 hypothetical protein BZL30_6568 [Mycobacterium kansasii]OOK74955.1 hypothetical protein BZL29_4552 [Mycobacterium kansasii]